MKQLTFEKVCKELKKDSGFNDVLNGLDVLLGATILLLGFRSASGDVSAFINALAVKDEIIKIGKAVLDKLISRKTSECDKRMNLIQWTYSVIYYTAFFDVLDESLPENIRTRINLNLKEKDSIFQNARTSGKDNSTNETEICFPYEVYNYAKVENELKKLYSSMSEGLKKFVNMLSFEENSKEEEIAEFNEVVKKLPELAIKRFKAQYLYLASNFNEFYVLMQMEDNKHQEQLIEEAYQKLVLVGSNLKNEMDVGLKNLEQMIIKLPETIREDKVNDIVGNLIDEYKREIEKPIIESKDADEKLKYPSIENAFIPQSYKKLIYSGKEELGKEKTWKDKEEYVNMDAFWAKYCASPYGLENLLLILGDPGSGKSLLTKILCARMINPNNIFIRIPLREVDVEKDIEEIVCDRINQDGDSVEPIPSFRWFAENFKYHPITIVFDGYDEVLQATGKTYKNLLNKILRFQIQCKERYRPVRIIVTSRKTLIDKAEIPIGTAILKLMDFNESQRTRWIEIWNSKNKEVFEQEKINEFALPENNINIDELSRQPLLLLMLAIYDANFEKHINSLTDNVSLNRTKLYDELLKRFIRRELKKGARGTEQAYEDGTPEEQQEMVEQEMERLGVAALGMFNRGILSLRLEEMEKDLSYMQINPPIYDKKGSLLSNAELLVISFLFIHDSKSGGKDSDEEIVAFEFLHKTFYEFLVADLVLKYLFREIQELNDMRQSKAKANYHKAMENQDHLRLQYYTALMHTCLCKEPEIIQMLIEWKEELINKYFNDKQEEFDTTMEELFEKQIFMVCNQMLMPSCWIDNAYDESGKKSYFYYCATYLINLLVLKTITKSSKKTILNIETWKYISQFWKMNIEEEILLKFTAMFSVAKKEKNVVVTKTGTLKVGEQKNRLKNQLNLYNFLQDNTSYDICTLHCQEISSGKKQKIREILFKQGIDIEFEVVLGDLQESIIGKGVRFSFANNINRGCEILRKQEIDSALVWQWMQYIHIYLTKIDRRNNRYRQKVIGQLVEIILSKYIEDTEVVLQLFNSLQVIRGGRLLSEERRYMLGQIGFWAQQKPDLVAKYLAWMAHNFPIEMFDDACREMFDLLPDEYLQNSSLMIEFLKILLTTSREFGKKNLLDKIWNQIALIQWKRPNELLEIFRLCAFDNKISLMETLLFSNSSEIKQMIYYEPDIFVEILRILQMVKIDCKELVSEIEIFIIHFDRYMYENPHTIVKLVEYLVLDNQSSLLGQLVERLYDRYNILFNSAPEEAIKFLKMAQFHDTVKREDALKYSLRNFNFLVSKSIDSATLLLIICTEFNWKLHSYFKELFNNILYEERMINALVVIELLENQSKKTKKMLKEYFLGKYPYFKFKYPEIASKIEELYPEVEEES